MEQTINQKAKINQANLNLLRESFTHKLFLGLFLFEYIMGIIASLVISPLAWEGNNHWIHTNVIIATFYTLLLFSLPIYLIIKHPRLTLTKHVIAIAQMLYSAVLIHIFGGRIETHFHIFGSLAFLSFYCNPYVLITATLTVGIDHLLRGLYFPYSVYGLNLVSPYRWLEHVAWVLFEVVFLIIAINHREKIDQELSLSKATLEYNNEITEEKILIATKDLQESEKLAHEILYQSNQVMFLLDPYGIIINYNESAQKYLKTYSEEWIGLNFWDLKDWPNNEAENIKLNFQHCLKKATAKFEIEIAKNNQHMFLDFSLKPIYGFEEKIIYILAEGYDSTSIKEAKHHIANFCSTISHELRTPLTSIKGVLGLLDGGILDLNDNESKELIEAASLSCDRLILIINDILDLRKIEAGKLDLNLEEISVQYLVENALKNVKAIAVDKNLTITSNINYTACVMADKVRIIQVLTNFLSNALKFSYVNSQILVNAYLNNNKVRFEVINSGEGISPEKLSKVFDPFYQVDSNDDKIIQGSGLGLAICQALINQHDGTIGVLSQPNELTTFYFELNTSNNIQSSVQNNLENTIFILEDDQNLLKSLKLILEKSGYNVITASSLKETKAVLGDINPALMVLDVNLPDGCGLSLINENNLNRKVMIISGDKPDDSQEHVISKWLEKPFTYDTFIKSINQILLNNNNPNLLIVDDDLKLTKVIERKFKLAGFNCQTAHDGLTALEIIKQSPPDLIILDIFMPNMNGQELINNLRVNNLWLKPIIIYSGHDLTKTDKEKLILGATYFLTKSQHKENDLLKLTNDILATQSSSQN